MYFTDRGIEELEARRGDEEVTLAWGADRLQEVVGTFPEFETPVERLATWLARLDHPDDEGPGSFRGGRARRDQVVGHAEPWFRARGTEFGRRLHVRLRVRDEVRRRDLPLTLLPLASQGRAARTGAARERQSEDHLDCRAVTYPGVFA